MNAPLRSKCNYILFTAKFFAVVITLVSVSFLSNAATKIWKGTGTTNWATGTNWVGNVAPVTGDDVIIGDASMTGTTMPTLTTALSLTSLTLGTTQNVTLTMSGAVIFTITGTLTINTGSTLTFTNTGAATALAGAFTTAGTGLLKTVSTNTTVPLPTGKAWSFDVEYAGGTQKAMAGTYNGDLTISGTLIKTATGNITMGGGLLTISSTLAMATNRLIGVGTTAGTAAGLLTTTNTASTTPIPAGIDWLFEVQYNGAAQTVVDGTYDGDLTIAAGNKTAGGDIDMGTAGKLNITGTLIMGTNALSGTIPTTTGAGTLTTSNTTAAPIPSGITWVFNVTYGGTTQNVMSGTYNGILTLSAVSGTKTVVGGTLTVAGNLAIGANTLDMGTNVLAGAVGTPSGTGLLKTANTSAAPIPTGETWAFGVEYNGAAQSVVAGTYSGVLTMSGSGVKTAVGAVAAAGALTIGTGITFDMDTFALTGAFTTAGAGLLQTGAAGATPIPTGKTWNFDVEYNGAAQTVVTATSYSGDLLLSGSGIKTAGNAIIVVGALNIATGVTFNMVGFALTGTFTPGGTGLLQTATTGATPIPVSKTWTFAVEYTGAAQTVVTGTYTGLTTSGTGIKTAGGAITDNGALTIISGVTLDMSTFALSGVTSGASSGGLLKTANVSAAPIPSGITWANNVEYSGAAQTVAGGTYSGTFTLSGSGVKTASGAVAVAGTLTIPTGFTFDMSTFALTGAFTPAGTGLLKTANISATPIPAAKTWTCSVEYNGVGQTVISATSYGVNLTISGAGTATASGTLPVVGVLTIASGATLNLAANTLSGAFTTSGTGTLQTTSTTAAIPTAKTWSFEVEYSGAAQAVVSATSYTNLTISGSGVKTAAAAFPVTGVLDIQTGCTLNMSTFALTGITSTLGAGLLKTSNTSAAPIPTAKTWAFNVEYTGASVALMTGTYSSDLTLSGTAAITMKGIVTVGGDFHFALSTNAVLFHVNTGATTNTLTINGDLIATTGDFDFTSGTGATIVTIKGNFSNTGAKFETVGSATNGTLSFGGTGTVANPQTYTNTTTGNMLYTNYQVQSGTVLQLNSTLPLEVETNATFKGVMTVLSGGTLNTTTFSVSSIDTDASGGTATITISSGATLMTANAAGLPGAIPTALAAISYSSLANYEFDGTAAGITGVFTTTPTAKTVNNLTINSTNTVTASQAFAVTGALNITGTLNMGTFLLTGVATNTGTGTLETQATATAIPTGKTWTVGLLYDATTTQSVVAATSYNDISFTGTGNKTFPSGTTTVNGDWNSASNITIDLTTNTATVAFGGASAQALVDAGSNGGAGVVFKNVNFLGGGTKTMSGTGKFSVSSAGLLTMSASTQLATGGLLRLKSDATGSAMVAAIPGSASITGDVFVERFMYGNNSNTRRGYRLMSSPTHDAATTTYNIFNLKQNLYITGSPDATLDPNDASNFDTSPNHGATIYHYNEPTPGVQNNADIRAITLPLTNDEFTVGEGMYVFYRGLRTPLDGSGVSRFSTTVSPEDNTLVFKGTLNQGTYAMPLSYTSSGVFNDGYNLLGNPYPSTIDISTSLTYNGSIDPFIYELDPTTKAFCTINKNSVAVKTGNASQYIASGQGFFVKATATGASVTFNESGKVTQQLSQLSTPRLLMSTGPMAAAQVTQMLKLKMVNPADSTAADDIAIVFDSTGKITYDNQEDALDFGGNGTVALSSFSSDNTKLAINTYPAITAVTKIKLGAVSLLTGNFNMVASNLTSLDSKYQAKLVDNYKTDTIKLSANSIYAFNVDRTIPATYADGRFEIVFSETPITINPVLSFSGSRVKKNIDLTWKVSANPTPVKFTLEKSTDNINFTGLTTMLSDSRDTYTFTDNQPVKGDNYYRLGQTDVNNHLKYADTIDVKYKDGDDDGGTNGKPFKIFPQPVINNLNIALNQDGENYKGEIKVKIMDLSGQVIKKDSFKGLTYSMDLSKVRLGIYVIELSNDKKVIGQTIFINL